MKPKPNSSPLHFDCYTKTFGKNTAVNDLTLEVEPGQITALLGSNGAGKTTSIQTVMNLHRPSSGIVRVFGVDSRKLSPEQLRQIGYVSENMQLPLWMTVQRYMKYCAPFYPTWDEAFANQLLDEFDLPRDRKLKHLSRGMRMKAALVGGIAYRPKLILLDEPFSGLDPVVRDEFIRGLLSLTSEQKWTVFLSSHDIEEVERLADRIAVIEAGKLRIHESVAALLARTRRIEVTCEAEPPDSIVLPKGWYQYQAAGRTVRFVTSSFEGDQEALEKQVKQALVGVTNITVKELSLREAYVALSQRFRSEGAGK